jgi:hypothetical protein
MICCPGGVSVVSRRETRPGILHECASGGYADVKRWRLLPVERLRTQLLRTNN